MTPPNNSTIRKTSFTFLNKADFGVKTIQIDRKANFHIMFEKPRFKKTYSNTSFPAIGNPTKHMVPPIALRAILMAFDRQTMFLMVALFDWLLGLHRNMEFGL